MAEGYCRVSHGGVNAVYYGRDKECSLALDSDGISTSKVISTKWEQITSDEILGNKEKGIRGRHDARVGSNIILSMPNTYTPSQCMEVVKSVISKTPAKDCYWSAWVHKGVKQGIINQHVHISINERLKTTGKKDRIMQKKGWYQEVFMKEVREEIKKELDIAPKRVRRERVSMELVQSDPILFREAVKALNEPKKERYFSKLQENGNFCIYDRELIDERDGKKTFPPICKILKNGQFEKKQNYELDPKIYELYPKLIPAEIKLKMDDFSANQKTKVEPKKPIYQPPKIEPKNEPEKPKFKMKR